MDVYSILNGYLNRGASSIWELYFALGFGKLPSFDEGAFLCNSLRYCFFFFFLHFLIIYLICLDCIKNQMFLVDVRHNQLDKCIVCLINNTLY